MNRFIRIPVLAASLLAVSLGSTLAFAAPPSPPAASASAPPPQAHNHNHRHGQNRATSAPGGMLEQALSQVQLKPEQRTRIEQIKASLLPSREATKMARQGLIEALAAEVQLGTVSEASLKAKVDLVADAVANERTQERAAMEKLHTILDKTQRATLASAMEAKLAAWHPSPAPANELRRMGHELSLTQAQHQQIATILRNQAKGDTATTPRQAKAIERRVLQAFKGESFSLDKVTPNDAHAKTEARTTRLIATAEKLIPVLTAPQRAVAATKLHERAINGAMAL